MAPVEVHYELEGDAGAPAVVLVNSLGTDLAVWERQLSPLSADLQVLRYDQRGHGRSPVPEGPYSVEELGGDLLALLDRAGIERASICGLSLGGIVAMWVAANAPDRVERLGLCCTAAAFGNAEGWHERAERVREGGVEAVADAVFERWFTPGFADSPAAQAVATQLRATPAEGYASCCEALAGADMTPLLAEITAPTLVISGAEDPSAPSERGAELAAEIANAEQIVLEGARHLANVERPDEFNRALGAHLGAGSG